MQTDTQHHIEPSAKALIPFAVFLILFIGTGAYLSFMGVNFAFYQLPAPVAAFPAVVLAIIMSKKSINDSIEDFIKGAGHANIIAMCLIFLLSGAFTAITKSTGSIDATVNLGLNCIPASLLLAGFCLISAFIATAMGTSMGTIAAVAPIALGIAQATNLQPHIMAGAVLSGAMFGDNLSIISDTTMAATRTQGCALKDKLKENILIVAPAALAVLVIYAFFNGSAMAPALTAIEWVKIIPYIAILIFAFLGLNVFFILTIGIALAAVIGLVAGTGYSIGQISKDIYTGFTSMQEIFLLSMLVGGLGALMQQQGGLAFIKKIILRVLQRFAHGTKDTLYQKAAECSIAFIVMLTNLCTANNTVAIIITGNIAKDIAAEHNISPQRSASLLDIFACVVQGLIPYGAQALLLGSIFKVSPVQVVLFAFYPILSGLVALCYIMFAKRT